MSEFGIFVFVCFVVNLWYFVVQQTEKKKETKTKRKTKQLLSNFCFFVCLDVILC